jgi:DNA topoisomerase IB
MLLQINLPIKTERKKFLEGVVWKSRTIGRNVLILVYCLNVCRKCYIHPAVIDAYIDGSLLNSLSQKAHRETAQLFNKLNPDESAVMMILDQSSKGEAKRKAALTDSLECRN